VIAVSALLVVLAVLLAGWSYLAYPAWIERLARTVQPGAERSSGETAPLEILCSASDEEDVIGRRVENLLAHEAEEPFTISIGCDGCRDRTAEVAQALLGDRGRVIEFAGRRGKAAVLNDLVASSGAAILVFTDANTRFEPGAVRELVRPFRDPSVGAVCGRLVLEDPAGRGGAETIFWDRETRTKEAEGALGVCLGANGAIYAARRVLVDPLPPGSSMDDFLIPVRIARRGARVAFAGNAVAREDAASDPAAEFSRRFRIGAGAGQLLVRESWLFDPRRHGLLSAAFLSRKAARWISPVLFLLAAVASLADPRLRTAGAAVLAAALLLALSAVARPRLPGFLGRLYYFCVINVALAAGVVAGLLGYRRPVWRRRR
jgi:cellulose synthase/poly-beta-1,6-N-acetylglucosamine synthase-like glycosyltransferase